MARLHVSQELRSKILILHESHSDNFKVLHELRPTKHYFASYFI